MHFRRSSDGVRFWPLQHRGHVFSCSFCGDFRCILASFCMILGTHLEAWSRCMNGHRSNSKRIIFIIFWCVFGTAKSSYRWRLVDFLKNEYKIWSRKSDPFWGHPYSWDRFFELFTRPRKKRAPGDDWWVWNINLKGSASTQKWSKNDASLSVGGFGGVRHGDRIRASGNVLFFHIVKYRVHKTPFDPT